MEVGVGRSCDEMRETFGGGVTDDEGFVGEVRPDSQAEKGKVVAGMYSPVGNERRHFGEFR